MYSRLRRQEGSTLLVTLIALIVVTFLALAMIRSSTINLRIAGNMQSIMESQSAAQAVIDAWVADIANFKAPANTSTASSFSVGGTAYSVTLNTPFCVNSLPASGYSSNYESIPYEQVWDISATATDAFSSAAVTVHQGIKVRMPPGSTCPN